MIALPHSFSTCVCRPDTHVLANFIAQVLSWILTMTSLLLASATTLDHLGLQARPA